MLDTNINTIGAWTYYVTHDGKEYSRFVPRVESVPGGLQAVPLFWRRCYARQIPSVYAVNGEYYREERQIPRSLRAQARALYTRDHHMVGMP